MVYCVLSRSVTCSKYNAHTDPLFIELKLLKIQDIYKLNVLKFFFKYQNETLPNYFYGMFDNLYPTHHYSTRQRGQPVVARGRTSAANHSIRYSLPDVILNTNTCIIEKLTTHSLNGFSNYAKQYYISQYNPICDIANCYICNREII